MKLDLLLLLPLEVQELLKFTQKYYICLTSLQYIMPGRRPYVLRNFSKNVILKFVLIFHRKNFYESLYEKSIQILGF